MPKHIIDRFDGGLEFAERGIQVNSYNEGRDLDPFLIDGYLSPSFATSTVTENNSEINDLIIDCEVYGDDAYFLDQSDRIYHMLDVDDLSWDTDFDGTGTSYKAITNATTCYDLIKYNISGVDYLFFSYDTASTAAIGTFDYNTTFNFTKINMGSSAKGYSHPMLEWNGILWYGNSQNIGDLGKYVGATDTTTAQSLVLGGEWEITALFPTRNYIGICAKRGNNDGSISSSYQAECRIFFWDGVSESWTYFIPINDNRITNVVNYNDRILLFCQPKYDISGNSVGVIRELTEGSSKKIKELKVNLSSTARYFSSPTSLGAIDIFGNRVIFGANNNYDSVFSFGSDKDYSNVLTILFSGTAAYGATNKVGMVRCVKPTQILFSYYDGTNYGLKSIATTKSTNALYKGGYADFGQRIRVNYIKFYFKPLVTSDSITCGLDIDYGTSVTLKDNADASTCTFSADGAITSKKFKVGRDCHTFRPTIQWNAGGVAISKIVIDYDFILDN